MTISTADLLFFLDRELDAMIAMVTELGDDLANRRLPVEGSNSPYAILNHCLGVMEYWGGHVMRGRPSARDRAAEFRARGAVVDLVRRAGAARAQLRYDMVGIDLSEAPICPPELRPSDVAVARTNNGVLFHIHEELARHRGHMDLTRDLLLSAHSAR